MLVVHPASLCDVCLDPYIISSEPANSPHAIACGHIFCLTCLRNLSPSACPLCRKTFQPDRVKKLHVAGPPELDGATEATIEAEATRLLQRVALVSGEAVPDVEIIEVVTEVEEWLSNNSADGDSSHRPLRTSLAALQRYKALQERNEREYAEFRRVRRELKAYRRNAHQDSKTSRAVEESLLGRIDEIENQHTLEVSRTDRERNQDTPQLTHAFQLSRLRTEIDSLRGKARQPYHNASNPLPPPPEPLPLDRFPGFARPGGSADTSDPLLGAVPYPAPPPRAKPTSVATTANGYPPSTSYGGTSHTEHVPSASIVQPLAAPRARHAEVPRLDERMRPLTQEANGINHHPQPQEERRPHGESSRMGAAAAAAEARNANADGRSHSVAGPAPTQAVVAPSPAPSWAHNPFVEERRSDDEREIRDARPRGHANGTNGTVANGGSQMDPRLTLGARLASAEAYIQGYGSGYDSGFQIASEPPRFGPASYGSDQSDQVHGFPVQESPDHPIGGLGLMGVPRPSAPGTVSTPDAEATPVGRARRLTRRNTTHAIDTERSGRRTGDQTYLDVPPNGGGRRLPAQSIGQVLTVRRTVTEGTLRHGVNGGGGDSATRLRRVVSGIAVTPLVVGLDESPRSETTWGTVQTLSRDSISMSGGSMGSLGMLVGLHNGGGVRGQGSVAGESYVGGGEDQDPSASDNVTSEGNGETETLTVTGSLPAPGSESDVSSLGLIREDEGDYSSGSRNSGHVDVEDRTPRHRSNSERNLETTQDRQARHRDHATRRDEGTSGGEQSQRRHTSQSALSGSGSVAEVLHPDTSLRAVVDAVSDSIVMTSTNALSLHFDDDASFPAPHGYYHSSHHHALSSSGGPEIFAPTPVVGGPNIIHLWANRV